MLERVAGCVVVVLVCSAFLFAADPFVGEWKANLDRSQPDPRHRPKEARARFEADPLGYRLTAYGINGAGHAESQTSVFNLDGKEHATPDGETTILSRKPDDRTIETIAMSHGQEVGRGVYVVSEDGKTLTATVSGKAADHQPFKTMLLFERQ